MEQQLVDEVAESNAGHLYIGTIKTYLKLLLTANVRFSFITVRGHNLVCWEGFYNVMPFTCKFWPDHVIETFKFARTCARDQARKDSLGKLAETHHYALVSVCHLLFKGFSILFLLNKILTEN